VADAITPAQLAAAVEACHVPMFAFRHPNRQIDAVLEAAWPEVHEDDVPAEAHRAARAAAEEVREGGAPAVLAALNAAAPYMPTVGTTRG
jgi:hypothetical protein